MLCQLLLKPHISFDLVTIEMLRMFGYRVVGQMGKPVLNVWRVLLYGKTYIALLEHPYS